MCNVPEQLPGVVKLLAESQHPSSRLPAWGLGFRVIVVSIVIVTIVVVIVVIIGKIRVVIITITTIVMTIMIVIINS